jgi:hypothetical protein
MVDRAAAFFFTVNLERESNSSRRRQMSTTAHFQIQTKSCIKPYGLIDLLLG